VIFISLSNQNIYAQELKKNYDINISTDRSFYVVGDIVKLHISIYNTQQKIGSRPYYVYCDLIGQNGVIQNSIKLMVANGMASSEISIPKHLLSGYYLVRAYTKEMRLNPVDYSYVYFKVVNISEKDIIGSQDEFSIKMVEDSNIIDNADFVRIDKLNKSYKRRSEVNCNIKFDIKNIILPTVSISVVPKLTYFNNKLKLSKVNDYKVDKGLAFDEERGITLSGQ
jgi:hypothetical protein